ERFPNRRFMVSSTFSSGCGIPRWACCAATCMKPPRPRETATPVDPISPRTRRRPRLVSFALANVQFIAYLLIVVGDHDTLASLSNYPHPCQAELLRHSSCGYAAKEE